VGTAPYLSPEQAKAKELDTRTDIWAFGCLLYEMLTGRRPFAGSTLTEVLAGVLERDPDWTALPPDTPHRLLLLLKRCLRKEPVNRLRDIGDARIELQDVLSGAADEPGGAPDRRLSRRTALAALGGAVAGVGVTSAFAIARYKGALPRRLTQIAIATPEPNIFIPSFNRRVAISPDGGRVVFNPTGPDAFFVRSLAALQSDRVKDVPNGAAAFFSPDGQWFGFLTAYTFGYSYGTGAVNTMRKLALSGGAPVTICPVDAFCGATWSEDGNIYWVDALPGGVMSIPANGGTAKEVSKPDFSKGERLYKYPCAIPGGDAVLVTLGMLGATTFDDAQIVAVRTRTGEKKVLVEGGTHPRYSPTGHLLYARDGKILAVRFDPKRLVVQGQPRVVLEGVQMSRNTGVANFDVSAGGDLVYVAGVCDGGARTLAWVDRDGKAEQVSLPAKSYLHPRLSPDGRRLAIEVEGINHDLYVYDFDRGVLANLTTDGVSHWPVWSPDGSELAFRSGPMGHFTIWHAPADRSGERQQVAATGPSQNAESWSPDGGTIAYTSMSQSTPPKIMAARLDGKAAERLSKDNSPEGSPKFSPDGRWIAFCAIESGKPQVFVQSFPGPGPKIQVSAEGGTDPVWRRQGGELYYRNGDSMMVVDTQTAPKFVAGRPRELWRGHYSHGMSSSCGPPGATSSNYDVTPDGKRFLMIKDDDQDRAASKQFVVVLGWGDELSRRDATA
jgi:eukaryotic-like serine/threonine-protein kinase